MQLRNSGDQFGLIARALHWATVLLVLTAWLLGEFELPKGGGRETGWFFHISAGLLILGFLLLRVLWRMADPPPAAEPTVFGEWGDRASRIAHYALYGLLLLVPISGIVVQFARGEALPLFGFGEIASPWSANRTFSRSVKEVHELLANLLIVLSILHVAAALVHHWILGDRTLIRMLPGLGRRD
jgi:cytochrome b561